jgi:hypothetical protein
MRSNRMPSAAAFALVLLLAGGCASHQHHGTEPSADDGIAASEPPAFLIGPASIVLTNANPYSGRASIYFGSNLPPGPADLSGNLMQQDGVLLYVPTGGEGRRTGWEGSFRFLWDVSHNRGYVLSEVLQAYAPISSTNQYRAVAAQTASSEPPRTEAINGQSCQVHEVSLTSSSGEAFAFRTWNSTELDGQLVQISLAGSHPFTIRLADLKQDAMAPELFSPPEDFVRYKTGEAMVREIIHRQMLARYKPFGGEGSQGRKGRSRSSY